MSKLRDIVKGASSAPAAQPAEPAPASPSEFAEVMTDQSADKADGPVVAAVDAPLSVAPEANSDSSRPSVADLQKAARDGREFEISAAVAWAPEYVPGTGFFVTGSPRRYFVGTAANLGDSVLETLATDDRYLVRLV